MNWKPTSGLFIALDGFPKSSDPKGSSVTGLQPSTRNPNFCQISEMLAELVSILPNFTLPLWWCSRNFYQTLLYILFTRIIILTSLRGRLIGISVNNTVASLYNTRSNCCHTTFVTSFCSLIHLYTIVLLKWMHL